MHDYNPTILSTLWMLNHLITYREWVFPNGAAAHADDAGWVEWLKHGGSLASIDNEQELIVPEQWRERRGIQSGPLQRAGSVLPTTSNGRMCSHFWQHRVRSSFTFSSATSVQKHLRARCSISPQHPGTSRNHHHRDLDNHLTKKDQYKRE